MKSDQSMKKANREIQRFEFAYNLQDLTERIRALVVKSFSTGKATLWHPIIDEFDIFTKDFVLKNYIEVDVEVKVKSRVPLEFDTKVVSVVEKPNPETKKEE